MASQSLPACNRGSAAKSGINTPFTQITGQPYNTPMKYLSLLLFFMLMGVNAEAKKQVFKKDFGVKQKEAPYLYTPLTDTRKEGGYRVELYGEQFVSTSRIDGNAQTEEFLDGESFSRLETEIRFSYGYSRNLQFNLGARARRNQATYYTDSTDTSTLQTLTTQGVESIVLGVKYALPKVVGWRYALEGKYRKATFSIPEYDASEPNREIILGDVLSEVTFGGHIGKQFLNDNFIGASCFYNIPEGLSHELIYKAEAALVFKKFHIAVGVEGVYALGNDEYSGVADEKPAMYVGNTRIYNSVDRQYFSPYAEMGLGFSKSFGITIGGAQVMAMNHYDNGTKIYGSLVFGHQGTEDNSYVIENFKEYSLEATVIKVSPRGGFIQIDKGIADEIQKGMRVDIFDYDFAGGNKLLGSGVVYEVSASKSIVKITKIYQSRKMKAGNVVRMNQ